MSWLRLAGFEAIPPRGARVVNLAGMVIAVFRTSDDRVFALEDRCPHRGGPLSQGIVHGTCVTCPLHDWVIDLATGAATGADEGQTTAFPTRVVDGIVYARIAAQAPVDQRTDACVQPTARNAGESLQATAEAE